MTDEEFDKILKDFDAKLQRSAGERARNQSEDAALIEKFTEYAHKQIEPSLITVGHKSNRVDTTTMFIPQNRISRSTSSPRTPQEQIFDTTARLILHLHGMPQNGNFSSAPAILRHKAAERQGFKVITIWLK